MAAIVLKSQKYLEDLDCWTEEYATEVIKKIGKEQFMASKKRAREHLTLYGFDLPANGIDMKSSLQQMWDIVQKERAYLQQQEENGDEDGEGNAFGKRGVDGSVGAGDGENEDSRAGNVANKKRQKKRSEGDQDGHRSVMEEDLKKINKSLKRLEQANITLMERCTTLEKQLSKESVKRVQFRDAFGERLDALESKAESKDGRSTRKGSDSSSESSSDSEEDTDDNEASDSSHDEDMSTSFDPKWPKIPNHDDNKARIMCPYYCNDESECKLFTAKNRQSKIITDEGFIRLGRDLESEISRGCTADSCCHTAFTVSKDLTKKLGITAKLQVLDDWNKLEDKDFAALRMIVRKHLMVDHGCDEKTMRSKFPALANMSNRKTKLMAKAKKEKKDASTKKKKKKRRKKH